MLECRNHDARCQKAHAAPAQDDQKEYGLYKP